MHERWNPWAALRARPHITLHQQLLRGQRGLWIPRADGTADIYLDVRLSRRERRCVLAHELVHDERGIAYTQNTPRALVQVEERAVDREVVRRLVPPDELLDLLRASQPIALEVWEISEHFDTDRRTARAALAALG